jgi:tetratricopeptide (TPR) repeat protein
MSNIIQRINYLRFTGDVEAIPKITIDPSNSHLIHQWSINNSTLTHIDDLYDAARLIEPVFTSLMKQAMVVAEVDAHKFSPAPSLKGKERAAEKARDDYNDNIPGPNFSWLFDIVRGGIECDHAGEIESIIAALNSAALADAVKDVCSFRIVRLKNRFVSPTPGGFRDLNLNIELTIKNPTTSSTFTHICEIQVHKRAIHELSHTLDSHLQYEFFRTYFKGSVDTVDNRLKLLERLIGHVKEGAPSTMEQLVDSIIAEENIEKMSDLANLLDFMSEVDLRIRVRKEHVKLWRMTTSWDHPKSLEMMTLLAGDLLSAGQENEALEMYKEIAAARTKKLGADDSVTLSTIGNIAIILSQQGKYLEAHDMFMRVYEGHKKNQGEDSHAAWTMMSALGANLVELGKLDDAEMWLQKALSNRIKANGDKDEKSVSSSLALGVLYFRRSEYEKAKAIYLTVRKDYEKLFGPEHPRTMSVIKYLVVLFNSQRLFDDAEEHCKICIQAYTKIYGTKHLKTVESRLSLAVCYLNQKKLDEAKVLLEETLKDMENLVGADHKDSLEVVGFLGDLAFKQGDLEQAKLLFQRSISGLEAVVGTDHYTVIAVRNNLAAILFQQNKIEEATTLFAANLASKESFWGPDHVETQSSVLNLGTAHHRLGNFTMALPLFERYWNTMQRLNQWQNDPRKCNTCLALELCL